MNSEDGYNEAIRTLEDILNRLEKCVSNTLRQPSSVKSSLAVLHTEKMEQPSMGADQNKKEECFRSDINLLQDGVKTLGQAYVESNEDRHYHFAIK
jgi:hypothetical protein